MLEKADIEKIERMYEDFMYVNESFTTRDSRPYGTFLQFNREAMEEGSLSRMHKELIALGIASFHHCEPCIAWHLREALQSGAAEAQIVETIEVAAEMGGGPVIARSCHAFRVLEYLKSTKKA